MQSGWQWPSIVRCCLWAMLVIAGLLSNTPLAYSTCYAKSRTTYMVKLQTSLRLGAKKVDYIYTSSLARCKMSCCREKGCDTSMYIGPSARVWDDGIVTKNCVLLRCGVPSNCRFSSGHTDITSTTYIHKLKTPSVDLPTTLPVVTTPTTRLSTRQALATSLNIRTPARSRHTSVGPTTPTEAGPENTSTSPSTNTPATTERTTNSTVPRFVEMFQQHTTQSSAIEVATGNMTVNFNRTSAVEMNFTSVSTAFYSNSSSVVSNQASTTSIPAHFSTAPALVMALIFGLLFTLAVVVMVFRRWMGYFRRPVAYQKADYLINGMYT